MQNRPGQDLLKWYGTEFRPEHLPCKIRPVDIGIPVGLDVVDSLVAIDFLFADRVFLMPIHQQVFGPGQQGRARGHGTAGPAAVFAVIPGGHVEVGAGEIAFVLVDGFEDRSRIAGIGTGPQLAAVERGPGGRVDLAVGITAPPVVHLVVGGIDHEHVLVRRSTPAVPAAGQGVFAIVTAARGPGAAALVHSEFVFVGRSAARNVGVHVPDHAVGLVVGGVEGGPQSVVTYRVVIIDDVVQSGLQVLAEKAFG